MTIGTLSGKILTDLILTGEREFKTLLSPSRIKPVAGFNKLIQQNVDVVKHLVSDRIFMEELKELAEMSNDEGRVVGYNDDKLALYKDTNGKLTALDPVCPHAKCVVQWNTAERS
jgi:Rieske Fe-S protein